MNYIKEKVRKTVADIAVPKLNSTEITSNSTFVDMGYDSFQFIKLILEIEENLGVYIEDEMLDPNLFENYGYFESVIMDIISTREKHNG